MSCVSDTNFVRNMKSVMQAIVLQPCAKTNENEQGIPANICTLIVIHQLGCGHDNND